MKTLTKTLVAATLAFGATAANAAIVTTADLNAEAWMSVYDSTSQQTFTLDLGVAGLTLGTLKADATSANIDLTQFADWNAFKSTANLATTQYSVAVAGKDGFSPAFMVTGDNSSFFNGLGFSTTSTVGSQISNQALNINDDANNQSGGVSAVNDTTLVVDGDGAFGHHNAGTGSTQLWGSAAYNPNTAYGDLADLNLIEMGPTFTAVQSLMAHQFKLDGDALTLSTPAAVPVPAAVWMFGTALLGMVGISRKRKTA